MEPEPVRKRFKQLTNEEIQQLVEAKDSENTRRATKNAVATFLAFCNEVTPEEPVKNTESLEKMSKNELNELLTNFWPNARKKNGENYKKTALMGLRFGLQRHFLLKRDFDIINDGEFSKSNQVYEAAVVELKRQGFGRVDHHRPISKEDLEKIQSCYNPSSPDPKSLQQVVWFNLMFHLIRRGRENLRLLTKQTFAVQADATGKKYVYQALDELDKNHRGKDQPDDSPGEGRMYERPNSPYCPVKTFELYLSKLNPSLSCLWQRPKVRESFSESDEVWYCNAPLGKNTLATLMSSISKEIQLSYQYTNHCIRETAVSLLDECNFEARHIMRVSGHKSESSIRSYSRRLSEVKQKEISHSLSTACFESLERQEQTAEADCPLVGNTVPRSPITMQNFASQSQETVNFNAGAFSGATVTINFYQGNSK